MNLLKKLSIGALSVFLFLFVSNYFIPIASAGNIVVTNGAIVDLTADAPTQSLASVSTPIQFDTNIHNTGSGSTGTGFDNSWNISTTASTSGLVKTISTNYPSSLAAGGQTYISYYATSPSYTFTTTGTYYVQACADSSSTVAETDETNNCSSWATIIVSSSSLVDLTADAPTQSLASVSTPIQFDTNIHNTGSGSTGTGFDNSWNISTTASTSGLVKTISTNYPSSLAAGGQTYISYYATSPSYTFTTTGTYYVQACADSSSTIAETDETNNCSSWTAINVSSSALSELSADAPTQTLASILTPIEFDTNIHNTGTGSTGTSFNNSWNISTTTSTSGLVKTISTNYPSSLASSNQTGISYYTTSPAYKFPSTGTYYVQACADSSSKVAETDETNNCSGWTTVSVSPNPLVELTADDPTQTVATTLTPIQFDTNIHNTGKISTGEAFNNSWEISTTGDVSNKIATLVTNYPSPLNAFSQTYISYYTTSPAYKFTAPGTYYVRACADSTNIVAEIDETNNCSGWVGIEIKPDTTTSTGSCSNGATDYPTCTPPATCKVTTDTNYGIGPCAGTCANGSSIYPSCIGPTLCNVKTDINYGIDTCLGICSNGYSNYPTCAACTVFTDTNYGIDSCAGTCLNGETNYPTCTATKPTVCTVSTDTNYNIGPCSGMCKNGNSYYPTCKNPIDPLATIGSMTATDCQIKLGSSTCNTTLTWSTTNPVGTSAVTTPVNITVQNANSSTGKTYSISFGTKYFYLYNNAVELDSKIAKASCASGTWDGTKCSDTTTLCTVTTDTNYNIGPCSGMCKNGSNNYSTCDITTTATTGNLSVTDCKIASGKSNCNSTITWSIENPIPLKATAVTTPDSITVPGTSATSGTASYPVFYGTRDFYLYHDANQLGFTRTATASCALGTDWDTSSGTCIDLPPGAGGWSDWSSVPNECPLASGVQTRNCNSPAPANGGLQCLTDNGTRALVETKTYPAITSDQCGAITDVKITPSSGNGTIDTTNTGSYIVTKKQVPYNSKLKIDWTPSNIDTNACTCTYKDSKHKNGAACINFSGTSSYSLPTLQRDTTFTISCAGSFSGNATQDIKVLVAPIDATYIQF